VRLGLEVAVLAGSLGKLATDLALMAQGEVGELAEPSGAGRGGSSAMPHKRNPVSSMIALAAATRTPQQAAALLAAMGQQHERGLGNWQAELAEWPALFLSAHGALCALDEALAGLQVDPARMGTNIDALHGLVFAEALSIYLAGAIGRPRAHALKSSGPEPQRGGGRPPPARGGARTPWRRPRPVRRPRPPPLTPCSTPAAAARPAPGARAAPAGRPAHFMERHRMSFDPLDHDRSAA
jgi:3-carboxy-cis,cis-muconate cycloisomerase